MKAKKGGRQYEHVGVGWDGVRESKERRVRLSRWAALCGRETGAEYLT